MKALYQILPERSFLAPHKPTVSYGVKKKHKEFPKIVIKCVKEDLECVNYFSINTIFVLLFKKRMLK